MSESESKDLRYEAMRARPLFVRDAGRWYQRLGRRLLREPIAATARLLEASEAYSWDLELMIEDEPYRRLPGMGSGDEVGDETLSKVRRKCRQWYRLNPMAGHWVEMTNDFVFGQGVSDPRAADPDVHDLITEFWTDQQNRRVLTSYQAMRDRNTELQVNGEVFLVLFVNEHDGAVTMADIDPEQIGSIVTHRDNWRLPLWYLRSWDRPVRFDFTKRSAESKKTEWWYPDWQARAEELEIYGQPAGAQGQTYVMHVKRETVGRTLRGLPPLWRALDWLSTHRGFLEDRATLAKARAFLSWIITQKGPTPKRAGEVLKSLQTDEWGRRIPPTTGSMLRLHESVEAKPVETPRDAGNAADEARLFEHMISAASGYPEPYFGDVSRGANITSTSLDLPVALRTEGYRQLWTQTFDNLFQFAIDRALEKRILKDRSPKKDRRQGREAEATDQDATMPPRTWQYVDIDFPPLAINQGVAQLITAIADAIDKGSFEEMAGAKVMMQLCGVDDAGYLLGKMAAQKAERSAVAVQIAQGKGADIPVDERTRQRFPSGERVGVRSPGRPQGAPATRNVRPGASESDLPDYEWIETGEAA